MNVGSSSSNQKIRVLYIFPYLKRLNIWKDNVYKAFSQYYLFRPWLTLEKPNSENHRIVDKIFHHMPGIRERIMDMIFYILFIILHMNKNITYDA